MGKQTRDNTNQAIDVDGAGAVDEVAALVGVVVRPKPSKDLPRAGFH